MDFYTELKTKLKNNNSKIIEDFISDNIVNFFNSPNIYKYYSLISDFDSDNDITNLTIAWLALLSGDNLKLTKLIKKINQKKLNDYQLSFYSDLWALSSIFSNPRDRLNHSDKTLSYLQDKPVTFYHANAYLTRGQIFNSLKEYRSAFTSFYKSYEYFFELDMMFPAAIALTNALLNKVKLAAFDDVIDISKRTLLIISNYSNDKQNYWEILNLPVGISYLEQNDILLAIDCLEKAYKVINGLELIHMHGIIELYLFKAYSLYGDDNKLKETFENTKKTFENMYYPMMQQIMYYGELLINKQLNDKQIAEIKKMYLDNPDPEPFFIEILVFLQIKYHENFISLNSLTKYIDNLRFTGNIMHLQSILLLLADLYYQDKEYDAAKEILMEAIRYYHDYNLKSDFNLYPYSFWPLVSKIDSSIKPDKKTQPLLTDREMDILLLINSGFSNQEISEQLFISVGTVKWHINHILSKLECKNRIQAIKKAKQICIIK